MRYKKNSYVVLRTSQYLPKRIKHYAGQTALVRYHLTNGEYQLQMPDEKQIAAEEKHIKRAAMKGDIVKATAKKASVKVTNIKAAKRPSSKDLRGMPALPDRASYRGKGCRILCVSGHDCCIVMDDTDKRFWVDEKELDPESSQTAQPRYKKGDHVRVKDMGWVRHNCTFNKEKRVWSHQGDNLSEIVVQAAAGKTFEIRDVGGLMRGVGTKWRYGITIDYCIPEWFIAECVYSAPVESQPKFKVGDRVRMLDAAELREKQLDYLPEALTEYQIQQWAGKVFTVEKTDKKTVLLSNGLWFEDWMIAGLADEAPQLSTLLSEDDLRYLKSIRTGVEDSDYDSVFHKSKREPVETQPTIEVGDTVQLPYDKYSPDLAGCKGRVVAQCGHLSDVTLDNGEWRRVVTKALTLVSKAAPESTKPVQSLTQRIEKLEKELSELKRRVG